MENSNQNIQRTKKKSLHFGDILFFIVEVALVLVIIPSFIALMLDYIFMAVTSCGRLFESTQSRFLCILIIMANKFISSLHFQSISKNKYTNASLIMLLFIVLFSFSTYSLAVQSKNEIINKQASLELPFKESNLTNNFNRSTDKFNIISCCDSHYIEFFRNGTSHYLLPDNFENLPDICCLKISADYIPNSGQLPCHLAMNACFERKHLKETIMFNYIFQSIYCYFSSFVWFLAFISVLTYDISTVDEDISV